VYQGFDPFDTVSLEIWKPISISKWRCFSAESHRWHVPFFVTVQHQHIAVRLGKKILADKDWKYTVHCPMMPKTLAGRSAKAFTGSPFSRDQQTSDQLDHMMVKSFEQHVGRTQTLVRTSISPHADRDKPDWAKFRIPCVSSYCKSQFSPV